MKQDPRWSTEFLINIGVSSRGTAREAEILLYLAQYNPLPDERWDIADPKRWTVQGMSEILDIPIASAYRAVLWLKKCGLIRPHSGYVYVNDMKPRSPYELSDRGRKWAKALMDFKATAEAIA